MKTKTKNKVQHRALAALPRGFTPIANPPGWTKPTDLYRQARQPEGAPPLPADATLEDAFQHAFTLLCSAHTEVGVCLAVRAGFNSGHSDPKHVLSLSRVFRGSLIAHFRAAAAGVRGYVNKQADEAMFLDAELDRLMKPHFLQTGSVSLCEMHALTARLDSLSLNLVEHYRDSNDFKALLSAVETAAGTDSLFLHTRAMPDAAGEQDCAVAA